MKELIYIDHHITPYIGKTPIEKLSTMDLQKLCRKLMDKGRVERIEAEKQPKGLSAKTVRNVMQVISSAMDFAVAQKIITENPCKAVELPKVEKQEILGHAQASTTLNLYAHALPDHKRKSMDKMSAFYGVHSDTNNILSHQIC